jgi:23S rRNA (guanosine2251-2'-O)-methyltransferase
MPYIYGRNPVLEALLQGQAVQKIYIQYGNRGGKIQQIYRLARQQKVAISNADPQKLRQMAGNAVHQGVVALISPVQIRSFEELPDALAQLPEPHCLALIDRIQDPHNMGAIIRSAEIFGIQGVIFPSRDNVPITDTVVKASAGAALHCPLYQANNLARAADLLKEKGIWLYGASLEGTASLWDLDFKRNCAVFIGGEEKGIRPLLQKKCDVLFRIPQVGATQSLNASVAAGIVLAEMLRQRKSG